MQSENYPWNPGGFERSLDERGEAIKREMRVALPGRIISFDPDSISATIEIMLTQLLSDGGTDAYPQLQAVPCYTLRGGKYIFTMPISAGDPCLVIFADRCIDGWFSHEAQDAPHDYRMHDLSDGFALVGPTPIPRAIAGYSAESAELRSIEGDQAVQLNPDGSIINRNAAGSTVLGADGSFAINAPAGIRLNGNTHLIGNLSSEAGNGGVGHAIFANIMRALDFQTPSVPSHNGHVHPNPEGGNVGLPFNP